MYITIFKAVILTELRNVKRIEKKAREGENMHIKQTNQFDSGFIKKHKWHSKDLYAYYVLCI